jgi:predicted MFS family arabinose efflux permease
VKSKSLTTNVTLYPWYAACSNAHFWMPVFFLYFSQRLSLSQVLRLEAIYYLCIVLVEVPSGYFSDRYGRRLTLLIASAALFVAYVIFFFGDNFGEFAVAQAFLAVGLAFNSGTDTSLHYDSLASLGRESEFGDREAIVARNSMLAGGLAAFIGGAVAVFELRYAYLLSAGMALVTLMVVLKIAEPESHKKTLLPEKPATQLKICLGLLRHPLLAWIFAFYVLITVLNHIPYEFYQPYLAMVLQKGTSLVSGTPLSTGIHFGAAMFIASFFAAFSSRLCQRIGLKRLLLSLVAFQTLTILAMGLTLNFLIVVLVLFRTVPRALMTAPMNAAIAPLVGSSQRATFLSIQSLAGRLAFSGFLAGLSLVASESGQAQWSPLSTQLLISAGFGITGLFALSLFGKGK